LKYFTFLSVEQIDAIEVEDKNAQGRPQAQGILAREVTRLVHGEEGLTSAERITEALFSGDLTSLSESDLAQLAQDGLPTTQIEGESQPLVDLLTRSELAKSNKMAREFIANGAVAVNGEKITDPMAEISKESTLFDRYMLIKRGKKLFNLFIWA
jgi:tyrosyl-tRNA synthetase